MVDGQGGPIPLLDLGKRLQSPFSTIVYLLLATLLSLGLGLLLGSYLLPLVQAAAIFPLFFSLLTRGRWWSTLVAMISWAALTALLVASLSHALGPWMGERVLLGESYRAEMFHWVQTGEGPEGDPSLFIPQHLFHFLVFSVLSFLSGGFLGLAMGAVLTNYMAYYVGHLISQSLDPSFVVLLAWPPWAAVRVVAFIMAATALSAVSYEKFGVGRADLGRVRLFLTTGLVLLLIDVLLKWILAPTWQQLLLKSTDLNPG